MLQSVMNGNLSEACNVCRPFVIICMKSIRQWRSIKRLLHKGMWSC